MTLSSSSPLHSLLSSPDSESFSLVLWVDDKQVTSNFSDYTLRFSDHGEREWNPEPALYYQGKRVTKKWYLQALAIMGEDVHGNNANTA